jgi:hypothetical protein
VASARQPPEPRSSGYQPGGRLLDVFAPDTIGRADDRCSGARSRDHAVVVISDEDASVLDRQVADDDVADTRRTLIET